MRLSFTVLVVSICSALYAQIPEVMPQSYVPGGATSTYSNWVPMHNPAGLAWEKYIGVQMQYDNRFITYELSTELLALAFPTKYLNMGVSLSFFGYAQYHEMLVSATFAKNFGGKFLLGVEAVGYAIYLSPTRRYIGTLFANVGMQYVVNETVILGLSVYNPFAQSVRSDEFVKQIPTTLAFGVTYRPISEVACLVQVDAKTRGGVRGAIGLEYAPFKQVVFRGGVYAQTKSTLVPTLGVGFSFGRFGFDWHAEWLPRVGVSLLGNLSYRFDQ